MPNFNFFFQPLAFAFFRTHFSLDQHHPEPEIIELYERYLADFHHYGFNFYRSQYNRHYDVVWKVFLQQHDIDRPDSLTEYEQEVWERYAGRQGLWEHEQRLSTLADVANRANAGYTLRFKPKHDPFSNLMTASDMANQMDREMKLRGPSDHQLAEVWFNTSFNNPPELQHELRQLPYREYLQTEHWQRVRAAIMLLYGARCQEEGCWLTGDSWYGGNWETDIHVHHLSYKNRGNERFADLTLLCQKHHTQWHAHKNDPAHPQERSSTPTCEDVPQVIPPRIARSAGRISSYLHRFLWNLSNHTVTR